MEEQKIRYLRFFKGFHFVFNLKLLLIKFFCRVNGFNVNFSFPEEAKQLEGNDQTDINKLWGLSSKILHEYKDICMIGYSYNPNTDMFDVFLYYHNMDYVDLSSLNINMLYGIYGTNIVEETINSYTKYIKIGSYKAKTPINLDMGDYGSFIAVYDMTNNVRYQINKRLTNQKYPKFNKLITGFYGGQQTPNRNFKIPFKFIKW